jgi:hypothetical protein
MRELQSAQHESVHAVTPAPPPQPMVLRSKRFSNVPGQAFVPGVTMRPDHGLESDTTSGVYNLRLLQHLDMADLHRMVEGGCLSEWTQGVQPSRPPAPRAHAPTRQRTHAPTPAATTDLEDANMQKLLEQVCVPSF